MIHKKFDDIAAERIEFERCASDDWNHRGARAPDAQILINSTYNVIDDVRGVSIFCRKESRQSWMGIFQRRISVNSAATGREGGEAFQRSHQHRFTEILKKSKNENERAKNETYKGF